MHTLNTYTNEKEQNEPQKLFVIFSDSSFIFMSDILLLQYRPTKAQSVFIPLTQLYCLFVTFQLILYVRLFTCISNRKPVRTPHHTRCLQTGGTHSTCMACWYSHPSLLNTPAILLLPYYLMQLCLLFLCFLVVFQRNSTEQKKKIRKKEARKKRKSLRENVREKRLN